MKERPILMSGPMVRAILDGRKTQTRREVKPQWSLDVSEVSEVPALDPILKCVVAGHSGIWEDDHGLDERRRCPYGQPGDRLWVKETYIRGGNGKPVYCADADPEELGLAWENGFRKTPSIFMRRWESRITLEVTAVRVERLQDMEGQAPYRGESDALAEGVNAIHHGDGAYYYSAFRNEPHGSNWIDPTDAYRELWESINGAGSWAKNPWVWVIEFKGVSS